MWALTDCFISFSYPIATFYVGADGFEPPTLCL